MIKATVRHIKDGTREDADVVFPGVLPRPGDEFVFHSESQRTDFHYRVKHVQWHCYENPHGPDHVQALIDVDKCHYRETKTGVGHAS